MGMHTWWARRVGRAAARITRGRAVRPVLDRLEDRSVPAVVGYYDTYLGQGNPGQAAPITAAGQTPRMLYDLAPADLAGVDVLFVQNPDNGGYGGEYLSRLGSIQAAVSAGMTLIVHDRHVDNAGSILPGGAGFDIVRDLSDSANIDVLDDGTRVTHGPGGVVDNSTLDGGNASSHGFAVSATLPADARRILSTGDHTHVVDFSYAYGAGHVVYSTIPLDYYLGSNTNFDRVYAPNVVAYGVDLLNSPPVAYSGGITTDEDVPFQGRLGASDPDGDPLTFRIIDQPLHGTVTLTDPHTGEYVYTSAPNYFGSDSFTFVANDGQADSAVAAVGVTVNPVNDPPMVDAGPDVALNEGDVFRFTATGSDVEGDPLTYTWDFGDGTTGAGRVADHAFAVGGVYTVAVTADDGHGGTATDALTATVFNVAPAVSLPATASADEGSPLAAVGSFADPGAGSWTATVDYGDGSGAQSLALNPDHSFALGHTYADEGDYTVTVQVSDGDGGVGTATLAVNVLNVAPRADAGPDVAANEGDVVTLTGTFSDPGSDAHQLSWVVADPSGRVVATGPGASVTLVPADGGVYTATFTVTDDDGGTSSDTALITVANVAPAVSAGPDASSDEGGSFTGAGSFADPGADAWTATVDYGDGSGAQPLALNPDKTFALAHRFVDGGVYTVTVRVSDGNGGVGTGTLRVTVANVTPTVALPGGITVPEGATFSTSGSFADPGADAWTATVDYGDGSGAQPLALNPDKTFALAHTYADDGTYTVTVRVDDGDGGVGTATLAVTVTNVAPAAKITGPTSGLPGQTLNFSGSFTDPGTADTFTLRWWVIDSSGTLVATGTGKSLSFRPPKPGVYAVIFVVGDDDGGLGIAILPLSIGFGQP